MTGFIRNITFSQRSRGVCDIQRGVNSVYVYCDVCKENIVENRKVPLLHIVLISGDHGDYVWGVTRHLYMLQYSETTYGYKNRYNR